MARRAPRTPLLRLQTLTFGDLQAAEREALVDEAYAIFGVYFEGHDREAFCRVAMPSPQTRLALLQTFDGVTRGFAATNIQRLTIGGRVHAAVSASVFVLPAYRGGTLAATFVMRELLRFIAREPGVPVGYLGLVLGPTTYQRFASTFERTYPNRRTGFPPEAAGIARAFLEARGVTIEGAPPWVVELGVRPLRTASITGARAKDPHIQYYCAANPGYLAGQALAMWVPIDRSTLVQGVRGLLRGAGAEALHLWRARRRRSLRGGA